MKDINTQAPGLGYPFGVKCEQNGPKNGVDEFQREEWNADAEEITWTTATITEATGKGLDESRYPWRCSSSRRLQVATGLQGNQKRIECRMLLEH